QLCSNDIEQVGNLLEANNRSEIINFFHPFEMSHETARKILNPLTKDLYFVAILNNEFIGMSMLRGFDEGFDIPSFGIFIDFLYQNQGYGRKLMEWPVNWADKHNIEKIRLGVYANNKIALKLYQSLGFTKSEEYKDKFGFLSFIMHRYFIKSIE
ncbi:MAG: GNAT family N-acetyltransferase, partial [Nanoarchaeota archaeon]